MNDNQTPSKAPEPAPTNLSVRELQHARTDLKRNKTRTPIRPMSDAQRAHNMSAEHHAMLKANVDRYRAQNGGKVPTRKGVADGWGGRALRARRQRIISAAQAEAVEVMALLVKNGVVRWHAAGNAVLAAALGIALAKDPVTGQACYPVKDQMQAAKIVADYTLAKPAAKVACRLSSEGFLEALLAADPVQ